MRALVRIRSLLRRTQRDLRALTLSHKATLRYLKAKEDRAKYDSEIEVHRDLLQTQIDQGSAYTTLVLGIMYVALFTCWGSLIEKHHTLSIYTAGVYAMFSVGLFSAFETFRMVFNVLSHRRLQSILVNLKRVISASEYNALMRWHALKVHAVWRWIVWPTIATALAAWVCLLSGFLQILNAT